MIIAISSTKAEYMSTMKAEKTALYVTQFSNSPRIQIVRSSNFIESE